MPSEDQVARGASALVPFVHEWCLSLNPENLDLMAYAVLLAVQSERPLEEIQAEVGALIADDARAHAEMLEAMQRTGDDQASE